MGQAHTMLGPSRPEVEITSLSGIGWFIIRRSVQTLFILWAVSLIAFAIVHLAPGGPFSALDDPSISPETLKALRASSGLDDPVPVQYARWLGNVARGDFGRSLIDSRSASDKIVERLSATLELNVAARLLGLLGIPLGIYAALRRGQLPDQLSRMVTAIASATPHWWLGLLVLVFVAAPTGWIPLGGMYTIGKQNDIVDRLWHLALPASIAAIGDLVLWSRFLRTEVLEVLSQDYIRTARAKGLPYRLVITRHLLGNALIPVVTVLGGTFASVISSSVILETTFSWPGIGRLAYTAAIQRDYPVVMALLMISTSLVLIGSLLADVVYTLVDPRIRLR